MTDADLRMLIGTRCECIQSALRRKYPGIVKRAYEDQSVPCFTVTFTDNLTHYFGIPGPVQALLEQVDECMFEVKMPRVIQWPELEARCRKQATMELERHTWRDRERARRAAESHQ